MKNLTFNECPRPQLVRDNWINLDGEWDFRFDWNYSASCYSLNLKDGFEKEYIINVPFAYETKKSGVNIQKRCDSVWYQKILNISKEEHKKYMLHLEGADYEVSVFVNGKFCGSNFGAYHRMSFDLSEALINGNNVLVINCKDDYNMAKPRGKQRWKDESFSCFYVDTTGIYKSVWLEIINEKSISNLKLTPDLDNKSVGINVEFFEDVKNLNLDVQIYFEGEQIACLGKKLDGENVSLTMFLTEPLHLWNVNEGNLYDVFIKLEDENGLILDKVSSYFGLRKISIENGLIKLNDEKLYQKLILNQGYWESSDLTAPNIKALYDDIKIMQELGFNGCRMHQKFEDERFLYYADVLGFLVWCEMPSNHEYNEFSKVNFEREWMLEIAQAYNHPSIITYVIFNESWGINNIKTDVEQQEYANKIFTLTKKFDDSRLVVSNDGWEHIDDDLLTIHHYEQDGEKLKNYFSSIEKCTMNTFECHDKGAFANGCFYSGQPILISEFGGTAFEDKSSENWGYGTSVKSKEEFVNRLDLLFKAIQENSHIQGYCYTQLSDVQQEVNGLLFYDHTYKIEPKLIKEIQDRIK